MSDTETNDPADADAKQDLANLADLLQVLDLRELGHDAAGQDLFEGDSQPMPHGRVYGGQVLGQTIVAAGRTVEPGRMVHSMHGYFLRPGDSRKPIRFAVERLRDGRSFTARRVHAIQDDVPILSMIASFQATDEGLDHQDGMPEVADPESLPSTRDLMGHIDHPMAQKWSRGRPIDVRHVSQPIYWQNDDSRAARQAVWMRAVGPLPDDELLHRAILGFASDYAMLEPVLRRHGFSWADRLKMASLDHAMWWHRPVRADEWLLFVLGSPSASGARGLGVCRVFNREGTLVATVGQEGMVRPRRG